MFLAGGVAERSSIWSCLIISIRFKHLWWGWGQERGFPNGSAGKEPICNVRETQETWVRSPGQKIATHSSTLAWKIPWIEEPGSLQSMGSQRVRHDWATDYERRNVRAWSGMDSGKSGLKLRWCGNSDLKWAETGTTRELGIARLSLTRFGRLMLD